MPTDSHPVPGYESPEEARPYIDTDAEIPRLIASLELVLNSDDAAALVADMLRLLGREPSPEALAAKIKNPSQHSRRLNRACRKLGINGKGYK